VTLKIDRRHTTVRLIGRVRAEDLLEVASRTGSQSEVARGETAAVTLPQAAVVKAVEDERRLHLPIRESELSPSPHNKDDGVDGVVPKVRQTISHLPVSPLKTSTFVYVNSIAP
jgi:hypothetical protein